MPPACRYRLHAGPDRAQRRDRPACRAPGRKVALLGEIVAELGFATPETVEQAVADARSAGRPIGEWLVDSGAISGDQLAEALAYRFGVDHVHLSNFAVDMAAANLIVPDVAKRLEAVPVGFVVEGTLVVAMRDPANVVAIDDIAMLTGYNVRPAVATRDDIHGLIARSTASPAASRRSPTRRSLSTWPTSRSPRATSR